MKIGLDAGEYETRTHRSRRLLGVVILLLFITGCIGLQVLLYLASSDGENKLWRVGILANSTADYSLDEIIQVAPISPDILEELAREDALSSPTPSEAATPPVIGLISPTQTSGSGGETTPTLIVTLKPTSPPIGTETPVTPTSVTLTPDTPTPIPLTPTTSTPITRTPTTQTPTFTPTTPVPTTKVPTTPVATTTVPPTPTPTTKVPTTPAATTTVPPTPIPTTRVPPTPIPTTQAPTPTPFPTSTGVIEIPTPWVPPTEVPTLTQETPPGNGLDAVSTPTPPKTLTPTRLDVFFMQIKAAPPGCQLIEDLDYSTDGSDEIVDSPEMLHEIGVKLSLFSHSRFRSMT